MFHYDSRAISTKTDVLNVVELFKLFEWVWTLYEATFSISKLADLIVAPKHKSTVAE